MDDLCCANTGTKRDESHRNSARKMHCPSNLQRHLVCLYQNKSIWTTWKTILAKCKRSCGCCIRWLVTIMKNANHCNKIIILGCLYYGATTIAISDATVLQFSTPIWVPFIAFAMIREPITLTHMIATFFGISGVILIAQPAFIFGMKDSEDSTLNLAQPGSKEYLIASLVCVIGAMFAGLVYTIIRKTGVSIHFQVMVFYYGFVGGFFLFFYFSFSII